MKTLLIVLSFAALVSSCGKSNKVSSGNVSGANGLDVTTVSFEGVYDIVRMDTEDCGASIRIVQECAGYRLLSNRSGSGPEDFCNVNRVPPNPDRNRPGQEKIPPIGPDRNPSESPAIVTLVGNQLKSTVTINERMSFTSTLTLDNNGILVKVSDFKSRASRCVYQKR